MQFIDDKSDAISSKSLDDAWRCANEYIAYLKNYYVQNILTLNDKKTTFVQVGVIDSEKRLMTLKLSENGADLTKDLSMKNFLVVISKLPKSLQHMNGIV